MRRASAFAAVLAIVVTAISGARYYRSPERSIRALASALKHRDLRTVERYADINALGSEIQNAVRYHTMFAVPQGSSTAAGELAMNEVADGSDFAGLARKWVERIADTGSFSAQSLYLLDPGLSFGGVDHVSTHGNIATAVVLIRSSKGVVPCALALRRHGRDWQVMDADLESAERALVAQHQSEIRAAFAAAR